MANEDTLNPAVTARLGALASILSLLAVGCDSPKGNGDFGPAPECSVGSTAAGGDEDGEADGGDGDTSVFIPASCTGSLFGAGVEPDCAVTTSGTLTIGDETHALGYSCYTETVLFDLWSETFFEGFFLALVGENCDPMLGIMVADLARYGEPPFEVNLDERLCDAGDRRAATVMVRVEGGCYEPLVPVEGKLAVTAKAGDGIIDGTVEVISLDGDDLAVKISARFEMGHEIPSAQHHLEMDFADLCGE